GSRIVRGEERLAIAGDGQVERALFRADPIVRQVGDRPVVEVHLVDKALGRAHLILGDIEVLAVGRDIRAVQGVAHGEGTQELMRLNVIAIQYTRGGCQIKQIPGAVVNEIASAGDWDQGAGSYPIFELLQPEPDIAAPDGTAGPAGRCPGD